MNEVADVLREARLRILAGWVQGAAAQDALGKSTRPWAAHACAWDAIGALNTSSTRGSDAACCAFDLLLRVAGGQNIVRWNDDPDQTQAGVVAAFDQAIALAEKE